MTYTKSQQDIMAAIECHWTIHALRRFRKMIVTVLPLRLGPNRSSKLKTLTV
jgi:hypothetical protein